MKATEQYFPVVLFIMLYKVVLPLESVDQILKCEQYYSVVLMVLGGSRWCKMMVVVMVQAVSRF